MPVRISPGVQTRQYAIDDSSDMDVNDALHKLSIDIVDSVQTEKVIIMNDLRSNLIKYQSVIDKAYALITIGTEDAIIEVFILLIISWRSIVF